MMFSNRIQTFSLGAIRTCFPLETCSKLKIRTCVPFLRPARNLQCLTQFHQSYRSLCLSTRLPNSSALPLWYHTKNTPTHHTPVFLRAEEFPDRIALVDENRSYTYRDLSSLAHNLCDKITHVLGNNDLSGERIAILCPNNVSYVLSQWATWMCDGISVPLCTSHPPSELEYVISDSGSKLVITTEELAEKLENTVKELGVSLLVLKKEDYLSDNDDILLGDEDLKAVLERRYNRENRHQQLLEARKYKNKSALIIYTSGTTGRPKGVVHTHGGLGVHIAAMSRCWGWTANDVVLHSLPLHHVHGVLNLLMVPLHVGATCVMLPKFDADKVWSHLLGPASPEIPRRINMYMAVPTIYAKLIERYDQRFGRGRGTKRAKDYIKATCSTKIRLMVSGSAALPEPVLNRWEQITGHRLLERYGMTEVGMALTNPLKGVRTPGCEGEDGELLIRGPGLFKEYWGRPEATKKEFTEDGWFKTGDTAVYENGNYKILGRTSVDILKSGGYKLSALEIERHLLPHPSIADIAVIGLPDITWGQKVTALIVLKKGETLELEELKEWASSYLPNYKIPTVLKIIEEMPKNALGKINKKELAQVFFPKEMKKSY